MPCVKSPARKRLGILLSWHTQRANFNQNASLLILYHLSAYGSVAGFLVRFYQLKISKTLVL